MGATATTTPCNVLGRSRPFLALLLCFQLLHTSQAFEEVGAATSVRAGLVPLLLGLIVMMASFGL